MSQKFLVSCQRERERERERGDESCLRALCLVMMTVVFVCVAVFGSGWRMISRAAVSVSGLDCPVDRRRVLCCAVLCSAVYCEGCAGDRSRQIDDQSPVRESVVAEVRCTVQFRSAVKLLAHLRRLGVMLPDILKIQSV